MITISGAAGKTGRAILRALRLHGMAARAMVRNAAQGAEVMALGAAGFTLGDQMDASTWREALRGARALYLICPNVHPHEAQMVEMALAAARAAGLERVVYHSVLHPQVEAMPHHWQKMRGEEAIFASGMAFTILQPCAYMQNLLGYWGSITREGIYPLPYSPHARVSLVDLADVAEAAARVLREDGHTGAIYELSGPEALTQTEVALRLSRELGRPVTAKQIDREAWRRSASQSGLHGYALETLIKMFVYYDQHGLIGNPRVLTWLLGRAPRDLTDFIKRVITEKDE